MKKFRNWCIAIGIVIGVVVILWIIKTPILASYLSNKLKTDVSMSNISITTKKMTIKNFRIKNPRKSKNRYAFIVNNIDVNYSFSKLMSSPSVIDSTIMQDVALDIECSNPLCTTNNWTNILNNISSKQKKSASKKEVIVSSLEMKNMDVSITGFGLDFGKTKKTNIASLEFKNVSNKTGFPTAELIAAIFKSAGLKDYLKGILDGQNFIKDIFKSFSDGSDNSLEERIKAI